MNGEKEGKKEIRWENNGLEEGKGEELEEEMSIGGGRGRKRNIAKEISRGGKA
jgi:hypothetical protein